MAYVAATRARDLLAIPAIGDDPTPGVDRKWLPSGGSRHCIRRYSAIYPPEAYWHKPSLAKQCPKFGIDSVLVRPEGDPADDTNVRPGAHGFGQGDTAYGVVWWDRNSTSSPEKCGGRATSEQRSNISNYSKWHSAPGLLLLSNAVDLSA